MTFPNAREWLHDDVARPLSAPLTMTPLHRSAERYAAVVAQFDVANAPRYRPRKLPGMTKVGTWCNVYASDVLDAVWAPIPHKTEKGDFRDVRAMAQMLRAGHDGWRKVGPKEAQAAANDGKPTVVLWDAGERAHGHIAVVVPAENVAGVWISQAGVRCYARAPLVAGFGALGPLEFFSHP